MFAYVQFRLQGTQEKLELTAENCTQVNLAAQKYTEHMRTAQDTASSFSASQVLWRIPISIWVLTFCVILGNSPSTSSL